MFDSLAAIARDSSRLADLAESHPEDARVPSCPDWSLRDLVTHFGLVQRFWGEAVRDANPAEPWDGEAAAGETSPIDSMVADDAVSEFLVVTLGAAASTVPGAVQLLATDTGKEWTVGGQGGVDGPVGTTVRASASDLLLLLYRRVPASAVEAEGDAALLDTLLATADTE